MKSTVLVGLGGIGRRVLDELPVIAGLVPGTGERVDEEIILVDGDTWDEKNRDRVGLTKADKGASKAERAATRIQALVRPGVKVSFKHMYLDGVEPEYVELFNGACVLVGVDNHRARKTCLEICDVAEGCRLYLGGNSDWAAEAYVYTKAMKGTSSDPRIVYPDILTDNSGSPVMTCQEAAASGSTQTALANQMAACALMHLWQAWENPTYPCSAKPVRVEWSAGRGMMLKDAEGRKIN